MLTNIILIVIVLHLIAGIGWLIYKLKPQKGDELIDSYEEEQNKK